MDAPTLENLTKGLNPLATPSVGHTVSPQDLLRWNQLASSLLTDRAGGENRPIFLFYLKIRRGEISSFGSYEAYKDDGEVCSRKEYEDLWLEFYPDETCWCEVTFIPEGNELHLFLNKWVAILDLATGLTTSNARGGDDQIMSWILDVGSEDMELFLEDREGYRKSLNANLPLYMRKGKIRRRKMWQLLGEEGLDAQLGTANLESLDKIVQKGKQIESVKKLTAGDFFRYCEICYDANRYFGGDRDVLSPKEKYRRMADGRHGGMMDLPEDDPSAFATWYQSRVWSGTHPWEICRGGNTTHISLFVERNDNGWFVRLEGLSRSRAVETARMALALDRERVPCVLYRGREMVRMIRGADFMGVVPKHVMPKYCHSMFPDEDEIVEFVNPWYDAEAVISGVEWYEIEITRAGH